MANWSFLTNHGRALLCLARDPEARLRDVAAELGITERRAYAIVVDLTNAGYVIKSREGRRNRYEIQDHLPLPEPNAREGAIGDVLNLLGNSRQRQAPGRGARSGKERRRLSPAAGRVDAGLGSGARSRGPGARSSLPRG